MKVKDFARDIQANLKQDPYYLDKLAGIVTVKHPSRINELLKERGERLLRPYQMESVSRACPFEVRLEDGSYTFLALDMGNCAFEFFSEVSRSSILSKLQKAEAA